VWRRHAIRDPQARPTGTRWQGLPDAQEAQVGLQHEIVPHRLQTSPLVEVDQVHEDLQGRLAAP
jgi:hypothetical protein